VAATKALTIDINGNAQGLTIAVNQADGDLGKLGRSAEKHGGIFSGLGSKIGGMGAAAGVGIAALGGGIAVAGAGLVELGGSFDEQFDKITLKTGATGDQLAGLQDDFRQVVQDVPTDFGSAGDAIAGLNQTLGLTGEQLRARSEQLINLSRITGTDVATNVETAAQLFTNWNVSTDQQGQTLDQLFTVTQKTGIGFEDLTGALAENGVKLRALGFDLGESAALLGTLNKAGIDASDVMPGLSKALGEAAKDGKDAGTWLRDFTSIIKGAPSDTAAANYAVEQLGAKAGPQFAALIREGKLSYDDLLASLGQGGGINQAAADTADFSEKWQQFTNKVMVKLEPLATKAFDAIGQGIDLISEKWDEWGPSFEAGIQTIGDTVGPVIDGVVGAFNTVSGWFQGNSDGQGVSGNVGKLQTVIESASGAFRSIGDVATQIVGFIQEAWTNHGQQILDFLSGFVGGVLDALSGLFDTIKGIWDTFAALFRGDWEGVWNGLKEIAAGLWNTIKGIVEAAINGILAIITGIGAFLEPIWGNLWEGIKRVASGAWDWIVDKVETFVGFFLGLPGRIWGIAQGMFDGIKDAFRGALNWVIEKWNNFSITLPTINAGPLGQIGGWTLSTPDIPYFHSGGTFRAPTPGGEGLAMLRDGERIATPGSMSAGAATIINNGIIVGADERALERLLVDALENHARNGGRLRIAAAVTG